MQWTNWALFQRAYIGGHDGKWHTGDGSDEHGALCVKTKTEFMCPNIFEQHASVMLSGPGTWSIRPDNKWVDMSEEDMTGTS